MCRHYGTAAATGTSRTSRKEPLPSPTLNENHFTNDNHSYILLPPQAWVHSIMNANENKITRKPGQMPCTRRASYLCGSLALLLSAAVSAEEHFDREVIIVGGYQEAYETAGSAHFIGPEELLKFNYSDIQDIIREVPGVSVQLEDGYGLRPNISIRGTPTERSSRVTLLEDGVMIAPAPYSAPSAYYFPTAGRMHAFEVLKGPSAITQGPYTIGGALNMISTPIPRDMDGGLLIEGGGNSDHRLHAYAGFTSDEGVGVLLETHDWASDGFHKIDRDGGDTGLDIQDHTFKIRYTTPDSRHQLDFKYQYADQSSDQSYLGLTDQDFQDSPHRRYGLSALDNIKTQHDQHILRYRFKASDSLAVSVTAYNNEHTRNWFKTEGLDLDGTDNGNSFSRDSWSSVIKTINKEEGRCLSRALNLDELGVGDFREAPAGQDAPDDLMAYSSTNDTAFNQILDDAMTADANEMDNFFKAGNVAYHGISKGTVNGTDETSCSGKLETEDTVEARIRSDLMGLVGFEEDDQADDATNMATRTAYDAALDSATDAFLTAFKEQVLDDEEANQQFHDYFSTERLAGILNGTEDTADGGIQLKHNSREYFSRGIQLRLEWEGMLGGAKHDLEVGLRYHEDEEDRIQRIDAYTQKDGRLILHDAGDWGHQSAGNRLQEAEAVSVHVHDRIEWGSWVLTPGFRYEDIEQQRTRWKDPEPDNVRANIRSSRKNDTSVFLPGMGVLFKVNDHWSLLAGYHKGFSAPSNSPGVEEEKADNYELGFRYAGSHLRGEVIAFYSDYENLLGECTASSGADCEIGDSFNGDAATVEGVEAMFVANIPVSQTINLPVSLSYTYIDTEFDTSFESDFFGDVEKGDPIPYIPEDQLRASLGLEAEGWSINVSGKYVDEVCVEASCGAFEKTDSSFTVDVAGSYRINKNVSLVARVENVTDEEDIVGRHPYGARPNKPRAGIVGIRVDNFF